MNMEQTLVFFTERMSKEEKKKKQYLPFSSLWPCQVLVIGILHLLDARE